MYSGIPGAVYQNVSAVGTAWVMPCTAEVNASFSFANGSVHIPIHPLDITAPLGWMFGATGDDADKCVGLFQPINATAEGLDAILGMAFRACPRVSQLARMLTQAGAVRNAYMLVNLGNFIDGQFNSTAQPYLQLLSTTNDSTVAHAQFVAARLNASTTPSGASPTSTAPGGGGSGGGGGGGGGSTGKHNAASTVAPRWSVAALVVCAGVAVLGTWV
jgi:hypothetical protein